jgi:integrase
MTKGIYKRGKVYWICYAGLDGKTVFESSHSDKCRTAEALYSKRKQEIREGKQPEPIKKINNILFKDAAKEYLEFVKIQRSYESKTYYIKALCNAFGNLPLRQVNTRLIEQFQSDKIASGKKPATVNRYLATLKHLYTKALDWDMIEEYAWKKVKKVKLLEENNKRLRYLTVEECQRLIECCNPRLKPIVIMALNTGMRKSEILNLTWNDIDMNHDLILLKDTKNGERREININKTLKTVLLSLPRRIDGGHVFYDPCTDSPYKSVKRSFSTVLKKAKIEDFHFHDLRHTFASHLVMSGVDITTVKELLGHKSLSMTLRYVNLAQAHKAKAVDVLDNALSERQAVAV